MPQGKKIAMCVAIVSSVIGGAARANDFCLELAKHGLFDKYSGTNFNSSYRSSMESYCSSYKKYLNSDTRLSGKYKDTSIDFGNTDVANIAQFVCSDKFSQDNLTQYRQSFRKVLSDNALEAIRACAVAAGVKIDSQATSFSDDDNTLVLDITYEPSPGIPPEDNRPFNAPLTSSEISNVQEL